MSELPLSAAPFIVHRDDDLLILHKPSGVPTTSPDGLNCLASMARELDPTAPKLHASSRLDAEVTGLVTFARTQRAIEGLLAARAAGTYERFYLALSSRAPEPSTGVWRWAIDKDPRNPRRRLALPAEGSRGVAASSLYQLVQAQPSAAVLLLRPQTGRTHQLRVHAAAAGVPLLGDRHYGGAMRVVLPDGRVVRAARVMLHCARLKLPSIGAGAPLTIDAPVPEDMRELFTRLGGAAEAFTPDAWV